MYGIVVTLALVFTIANANGDVSDLFSGKEISLGLYEGHASVGNVSDKYENLEPNDKKSSANANLLVGLLRRMFAVGIYPIPPLDPYINKNLKPVLFEPQSYISGKVQINSLTIVGAKRFHLNNLELRMRTGRIDLDFDIPLLYINVDIRTNLYLAHLIPVALGGKIRINLEGLKLTGALQVGVNLGRRPSQDKIMTEVYQVTGANVTFHAKQVKVRFSGMNLDDELLQSLDSVTKNVSLKEWIQSFTSIIDEYILNAFVFEMNEILRNFKVVQVQAFLLPNESVTTSKD